MPRPARSRPCLQARQHAERVPDRLPRRERCRCQPKGGVRPTHLGDVETAVDEGPLCGGAAVVEDRLANQLDLDAGFESLDRPDQHVVGVGVCRRARVRRDLVLVFVLPHRQRVSYQNPAGRGLPGGCQDVGARLVATRRRVVYPERSEPKVPGTAVQQSSEDAG